MGKNLLRGIKITRVSNAVAAGTTDVECSEVNMEGFDGVQFVAQFGTITATAVTSMKAQQDIVTGMANAADLLGTGVSIADDESNLCLILDIYRPREQFMRPVIVRGTANAVIDSVIAIQYKADKKPTTQDATTIADSEQHISPAEGTA